MLAQGPDCVAQVIYHETSQHRNGVVSSLAMYISDKTTPSQHDVKTAVHDAGSAAWMANLSLL